jgi:hypothetical protein
MRKKKKFKNQKEWEKSSISLFGNNLSPLNEAQYLSQYINILGLVWI